MELVKNRASGKPFIVLDDSEDTYLQLITPEGKVKRLKRHLFGPKGVANPNAPQCEHKLTKLQMDQYTKHVEE